MLLPHRLSPLFEALRQLSAYFALLHPVEVLLQLRCPSGQVPLALLFALQCLAYCHLSLHERYDACHGAFCVQQLHASSALGFLAVRLLASRVWAFVARREAAAPYVACDLCCCACRLDLDAGLGADHRVLCDYPAARHDLGLYSGLCFETSYYDAGFYCAAYDDGRRYCGCDCFYSYLYQ